VFELTAVTTTSSFASTRAEALGHKRRFYVFYGGQTNELVRPRRGSE